MLLCLNPNAAGVDIGATEIYIAVPGDRDPQAVRCFATFTEDLHAAANWLKACNIETVAMESTGGYWIGSEIETVCNSSRLARPSDRAKKSFAVAVGPDFALVEDPQHVRY